MECTGPYETSSFAMVVRAIRDGLKDVRDPLKEIHRTLAWLSWEMVVFIGAPLWGMFAKLMGWLP
jgi:hypothetical protein